MRIKPPSETTPTPGKKAKPTTRAERSAANAATRLENRHLERDYFGRPIRPAAPEEGLTTAAVKRVREGTVRLDAWLVAHGFADSRAKAKALIDGGRVSVRGVTKVKASTAVAEDACIEVQGE